MPKTPEKSQASLWSFFQKVMAVASVLVVPLMAWVVRLEVTLAVHTTEIERLKEDVSKVSKVEDNVNVNTVALAGLTEKIDSADEKMSTIIRYMRESRDERRNRDSNDP